MERNYTYIVFTDFVYLRIKGLIWIFNGLTNPNNLDKNAGDELNNIYTKIEPGKPIILDFKGISGITDHAWDSFFKSLNSIKREVVFINFQIIEQKINSSRKEFCPELIKQNTDEIFVIFNNSLKSKLCTNFYNEIETHILQKVSSYVEKSFYKYSDNEYHHLTSTPIYSNGEFDASNIISTPESFYWTSLMLADKVESIIQTFRIGGGSSPAKLLTVSLRSSPFAAAIALLIGMQVETVDHLGPIFKNYETDNSISNTQEYIYIGDFAVGGTEIKVSKTYALMRNARLEHAIVIGSLFEKSAFKEFHLHPLVYLKDASSIVEYHLSIPNIKL